MQKDTFKTHICEKEILQSGNIQKYILYITEDFETDKFYNLIYTEYCYEEAKNLLKIRFLDSGFELGYNWRIPSLNEIRKLPYFGENFNAFFWTSTPIGPYSHFCVNLRTLEEGVVYDTSTNVIVLFIADRTPTNIEVIKPKIKEVEFF